MDDPEMAQLQSLQGHPHGFCGLRGFAEFEFYSVAMSSMKEKEIDLNAAVRCPKKRLRRFEELKGLLKGKTFPGCSDPRMPGQCMKIGKVEQAVEHPGIAKVDFRRFHLALSDILMPGLKLSDHKSPGQDIEI